MQERERSIVAAPSSSIVGVVGEAKKKKKVAMSAPAMMMMQKLFLFIFIFSSLLVLPAARSIAFMADQQSSVMEVPIEVGGSELQQVGIAAGEELVEGRMGLELNDYPGSGPNNRHDPRNP